jgi:hypothetical protein
MTILGATVVLRPKERVAFVSSDVTTTKRANGANKRLLVRDRDGHAVELVESVGESLRDSHPAAPRAGLGETGLH